MADKTRRGGPPTASAPTSPPELPGTPANTIELNRLIGRLHQLNARQKIQDKVDELGDKHGLSLYSEQVLEDGTIELTLRG